MAQNCQLVPVKDVVSNKSTVIVLVVLVLEYVVSTKIELEQAVKNA